MSEGGSGHEEPELLRLIGSPSSVAVIGASDDPGKLSGRAFAQLVRSGFTGRVIPVNARQPWVQGHRAYTSVSAVEGEVETALIALPASDAVAAVAECASRGVRLAVVLASGFAEVGGAGAALQDELAAVVRRTGIRVVGPNCIGAASLRRGTVLSFASAFEQFEGPTDAAPVAIVTRSGAVGSYVVAAAHEAGLRIADFVHTGNEVDVSTTEVLMAWADRGLRAILVYAEGFSDAPGLRAAARRAAASDTPIVVVKVGSSDTGARAALSHTGAVAGADLVADGVLRQEGIHRVRGLAELVDAGIVFASGRRSRGRRVTIVTISGGLGILLADLLDGHGIAAPTWDAAWQRRMAGVIPSHGCPANPIDLTASLLGDIALLERALAVVADHPDTDVVVVALGAAASCTSALVEALRRAARSTLRPLVVVWAGGNRPAVEQLNRSGVPTFDDPGRAAAALALLVRQSEGADRAGPRRHARPDSTSRRRVEAARTLCDAARADGRSVLDEVEAKALLAIYGIDTVTEMVVVDAAGAVRGARRIGHPVAVKALAPTLLHKTEHGAVQLDLRTDDEVAEAAGRVLDRMAEAGIADGRLVVQRMVRGVELIAGVAHDPTFGPVVLAGEGGVLVEARGDTVFAAVPFGPATAHEAIGRLRVAAALEAPRGGRPTRAAFEATVARLACLAVELEGIVAEVDVNPIVASAADGRVVAVDALVVLGDREARSPVR